MNNIEVCFIRPAELFEFEPEYAIDLIGAVCLVFYDVPVPVPQMRDSLSIDKADLAIFQLLFRPLMLGDVPRNAYQGDHLSVRVLDR